MVKITKQVKLTAINPANEREIEMMVGKAMCAYANLQKVCECEELFIESGAGTQEQVDIAKVRHESEYEATIRILDFFVTENLYEIQDFIKMRALEMMGA